ncbi:MAG: di-heme oxidoredictase family protein, partial [Terriglobia bacterium]
EERFGGDVDADGDGFVNELTIADITAITVFQATLAVPGRVVSSDSEVRQAEMNGERLFQQIGCATCHIPQLPLTNKGWIYTEPNPYNPPGNLQLRASGYPLSVDLTSDALPQPRLHPVNGIVRVPAYTDLKLHDITSGPDDPNSEPLNQNAAVGSKAFFAGNRMFITRKLWGCANQGPFMHHGKFTTMREAVLAHSGEALASRQAFQASSDYDQGCLIEFLKTLQILPPGPAPRLVDADSEDAVGNQDASTRNP